ncbi:MAG: lycopene cyclase domain-containing protein, partial [Sphingobacteriales bacterium]
MIYLYLNIFTVFFPLALSFDKRVHFWKKWYAALPAILVTAVLFIAWDAKFTDMGVWGFNPDYLIGAELFGLPLEEVLPAVDRLL